MKKRSMNKIMKMGSLAACLIVALGIGALFLKMKQPDAEKNEVESGQSIASYPDVAPMVYVNGILFKKSLEEVYYEEALAEFVYVGKIESDITSNQTSTIGVPNENLQANTPIVGAEVYQYGEDIVVKVNDIYWLYEAQGGGRNAVDWDSLSEQEKMERDPMYNAD